MYQYMKCLQEIVFVKKNLKKEFSDFQNFDFLCEVFNWMRVVFGRSLEKGRVAGYLCYLLYSYI